MVIVILGILAASALPKFINLEGEANQAAAEGIAGALGSASAVNFASRSVSASAGTAVANCTDLENALASTLTDGTITSLAISGTGSCTYTLGGKTATFTGHEIN